MTNNGPLTLADLIERKGDHTVLRLTDRQHAEILLDLADLLNRKVLLPERAIEISRQLSQASVQIPRVSKEALDKVFEEQEGRLIVRKKIGAFQGSLPILILCWHMLRGEALVPAQVFVEDMKSCGLDVGRADRAIKDLVLFISAVGAKRWTRYTLSNDGVRRAEQLFSQIVAIDQLTHTNARAGTLG